MLPAPQPPIPIILEEGSPLLHVLSIYRGRHGGTTGMLQHADVVQDPELCKLV